MVEIATDDSKDNTPVAQGKQSRGQTLLGYAIAKAKCKHLEAKQGNRLRRKFSVLLIHHIYYGLYCFYNFYIRDYLVENQQQLSKKAFEKRAIFCKNICDFVKILPF